MKKFNQIFIVAACMLLGILSSCSYLDVVPDEKATEKDAFEDKDAAKRFVYSCYAYIPNPRSGTGSLDLFTSDEVVTAFEHETFAAFPKGNYSASNPVISYWNSLFQGIKQCYILLNNIDMVPALEASIKADYIAQAKFLIAYYHFLLVQGWYEVPIRKETVKDITVSSLEATPHAEALDWIIQEMEDCLDMVDDSNYDASPSHVKKTVVEGILARVCLWRAGEPSKGGKPYYEKAAKYAKAVYDSKKHKLNPDVYAMWKALASDQYETTYNESMWEVEFVGTRDDGSYTESRIGNVIGNLQENSAGTGAGYTYAFYAGSLILWDLYDAKDARRDLAMAPYKLNNKDVQVAWKDNQIVDRRCGKYRREWESSSPKHKNYTQENYCLLRYADVLLMLAEAENEANQGPTALAYTCINEVRKRAGIDEVKDLSYGDFQKLIRDERGRELCFESLRKYDLVRWGIYYKAIKEDLGAAVNDARWSTANNAKGAAQYVSNTTEKNQFLPIPTKELGVNTKLEQNKYWK